LFSLYHSYAAVIRELGYPSRSMLRAWIREFEKNKDLHKTLVRKQKYNEQQIEIAVNYYLLHGRCIKRTIGAIGYPSKNCLKRWIADRVPDYHKACRKSTALVNLSKEQKRIGSYRILC
jgi:hypothetical protein